MGKPQDQIRIRARIPSQGQVMIITVPVGKITRYHREPEISIEVAKRALFESQSLAATRVAASGRQWPHVAASRRRGLSEQVAASGRKWPQGGCRSKRPQVATSGRWPQGVSRASAGQPLAATRVVASGRKWPQMAASGRKWPLAARRL